MDWSRSPVRVDAELDGKGILVSLAGALKAQSDLHLGLHGDFQDLKLAGEVRILKARYLREFDEKLPPLDLAPGPAAAATGGGPDLSRMALDVKVRRRRQRLDRQPHGEDRDRRRAGHRRPARRAGRERRDHRDSGRGRLPFAAVPARERFPALRAAGDHPAGRRAGLDLGRRNPDLLPHRRAAQQALLPPDLPVGPAPGGSHRAADRSARRAAAWRAGASAPRSPGRRSSPPSRW